jgi:hypothetical protein
MVTWTHASNPPCDLMHHCKHLTTLLTWCSADCTYKQWFTKSENHVGEVWYWTLGKHYRSLLPTPAFELLCVVLFHGRSVWPVGGCVCYWHFAVLKSNMHCLHPRTDVLSGASMEWEPSWWDLFLSLKRLSMCIRRLVNAVVFFPLLWWEVGNDESVLSN